MSATTLTPVTVLTGFLGSGKSTLLNRALHDARYADTAVIVNEFGDIPIDHALVRRASENVIVLSGGCICCRVAGDLVQALRDLHFKRAANEVPAFRRAVIETTGLADPAPLLATLIEMPLVAARYALSGVVTTVDGVHGERALDEHPEAVKQAAVADRIVVTKADLAAAPALEALESRLAALNPAAPRIRASSGNVDASWLFDLGLHRHDGSRPDAAGWLGASEWRSFAPPASRGPHDQRIRSFTWTAPGPVSWDALEAALDTLLELRGERILRLKGLVNVGDTGPVAIHAVQHTLYPPAKLAEWPDNDRRTRLVFITRDLEAGAIAPILDSFTSTSSAS